MKKERAKSFSPKEIEAHWYQKWEDMGIFKAGQYTKTTDERSGTPYCIQFPPPNVTGTLHMGHAFNHAVMDSLVRYHRMLGCDTVFVPGTDHAGIATQIVVERQLDAQKISRHDLGREAFLDKVWAWKEQSGSTIMSQLRRLGDSADWDREYFTMDPQMSDAVLETFVRLYEQGLIYRGKRLVNWDPVLETAVSDLEVISEEEDGFMWHIRYPLKNPVGELTHLNIATTRPETLLGDVAVMVHPEDERYQHLIGETVILPLVGREIPIIADDYVDKEFGTGVVKVTPAHDFNDNAVGQRHNLEMINILTLTGYINENVPEVYQGLERFEARKRIVEDLKSADLLIAVKPHKLMVPRGDRTKTVIEPMLTDQWFVAMSKPAPEGSFNPGKSITEVALEVVQTGQIKFHPENWVNTYYQWLNNIQDWCISRQLWWGHQIPAWYGESGEVFVARSEEEAYAKAKEQGYTGSLRRDEDVLDTWFSSALVPFSTMGWASGHPDYERYMPSDVLMTGFDILFFWVARMIMMTMHMTGKIPFKDVYLHGLILDQDGQKMSKSKGNVLDPIDLIDGVDLETLIQKRTYGLMNPAKAEKITKDTKKMFPEGINPYGADAVRMTMAAYATLGRNIPFDLKRCEGYRNFCNKLWNASRFVLMNIEGKDFDCNKPMSLSMVDQWILHRLQQTITDVQKGYETFRLDMVVNAIYQFVWDEYCDWYLELSKVLLQQGDEAQQRATRHTLIHVLEMILRIAHPIIPFITEELWQTVAEIMGINPEEKSISIQPFPMSDENLLSDESANTIAQLKAQVEAIRALRGEMNISPAQRVDLYATGDQSRFEHLIPFLLSMGKLNELTWVDQLPDVGAPVQILDGIKLMLNVKVDVAAETKRLNKEIERLEKEIAKAQGKLNNERFMAKAPQAVIEQEKGRVAQFTELLTQVQSQKEKLLKNG